MSGEQGKVQDDEQSADDKNQIKMLNSDSFVGQQHRPHPSRSASVFRGSPDSFNSTRSSPRSPFLLSKSGPSSALRSPSVHPHSPSKRHTCLYCNHGSKSASVGPRRGSKTMQDDDIENLDLGSSMLGTDHTGTSTPRHSRRNTGSSPRYFRRERTHSGSSLRSPSLKKRPSLTSTYRGSSDDDQLENAIAQDSYLSGDMSDLALTDLIEEPQEYEDESSLDHSRQPSALSFVTAHERDSTTEIGGSSDEELETVHYPGIPRSNTITLDARNFKSQMFAQKVLHLVRDLLKVPGWADESLPLVWQDVQMFKVSGSMTNAVIFVSYEWPKNDPNPRSRSVTPLDSADGHEDQISGEHQHRAKRRTPPTLLLRIYGSASGSLISRRRELHILQILSTTYAIGPRVFGTFANGRIEEYFASRALCKEELRDHSISCWIGKRMRELHGVRLDWVIRVPRRHRPRRRMATQNGSHKSWHGPAIEHSHSLERPGPHALQSNTDINIYNSSYSSTTSLDSGTASDDSASTTTSMNPKDRDKSISLSDRRLHAHHSSSSLDSGRLRKFKAGVWRNFDKWVVEAKKVLNLIDRVPSGLLVAIVADWNEAQNAAGLWGVEEKRVDEAVWLKALRNSIDMPEFEQALREYRDWIADWEEKNGHSEMVFAHNDAQYGNLLLLNNRPPSMPPHHALIVVDLEYASANPRAFDIANHFHEWRADYHHADLPHLLEHLSYPGRDERRRFLGAYVDQGHQLDQDLLRSPLLGADNKYSAAARPRTENARLTGTDWQTEREAQIDRLEDEVSVWSPSSHAMWATWGIVQARDAIMSRIAEAQKRSKSTDRPVDPNGHLVYRDPNNVTVPGTYMRSQVTSTAQEGSLDDDVEKWSRDFERADKEAHHPGSDEGQRSTVEEVVESDVPSNGQVQDASLADEADNTPRKANVTEDESEEAGLGEIEFDYLGYAAHRIHLFRQDWARLKRGEPLPQ